MKFKASGEKNVMLNFSRMGRNNVEPWFKNAPNYCLKVSILQLARESVSHLCAAKFPYVHRTDQTKVGRLPTGEANFEACTTATKIKFKP